MTKKNVIPILYLTIIIPLVMLAYTISDTKPITNTTMTMVDAAVINYALAKINTLTATLFITLTTSFTMLFYWKMLSHTAKMLLTMPLLFILLTLLLVMHVSDTETSVIVASLVTGNSTALNNAVNTMYTSSMKMFYTIKLAIIISMVVESIGIAYSAYDMYTYYKSRDEEHEGTSIA